jgi:phosphoglycerate dehydrogenase-like enzyme
MKIAILDDYAGVALQMGNWSGLGEVTVFRDTLTDQQALEARLLPFKVLCVMRERTPLPGILLRQLPNLELVVTSGPRNNSIDLTTAKELGITVCGTESRKTTAAELALTLILVLARQIIPEANSLAAKIWQKGVGRDLHGLTLGIIGLGKIGVQVARLGQAFGMKVIAWSQHLTRERCAEAGADYCESLDALMGNADVVSIHLVLSPRTTSLVDARAFAAMKPGSILVNTSRGPIVDTDALLTGLRQGRPAMAGLDVFDKEPLPADDPLFDSALIESGRLLLTPHLGYATEATFALFYRQTAEGVRAWQAGTPVRLLT